MINLIANTSFSFPKEKERKNQDNILPIKALENGYLFAIADGVGGYKGGDIASKIAINYLYNLTTQNCRTC